MSTTSVEMRGRLGWLLTPVALICFAVAVLLVPSRAIALCEPYPVGPNSPTGVVGCETYGEGVASWYVGSGAARNDCVWPYKDCRPIVVTSLQTGISITVVPNMYCDCYTGTYNERLVDLTPELVQALGLPLSQGIYLVRVLPADGVVLLPDTSMGGGY